MRKKPKLKIPHPLGGVIRGGGEKKRVIQSPRTSHQIHITCSTAKKGGSGEGKGGKPGHGQKTKKKTWGQEGEDGRNKARDSATVEENSTSEEGGGKKKSHKNKDTAKKELRTSSKNNLLTGHYRPPNNTQKGSPWAAREKKQRTG